MVILWLYLQLCRVRAVTDLKMCRCTAVLHSCTDGPASLPPAIICRALHSLSRTPCNAATRTDICTWPCNLFHGRPAMLPPSVIYRALLSLSRRPSNAATRCNIQSPAVSITDGSVTLPCAPLWYAGLSTRCYGRFNSETMTYVSIQYH